jgi:D-arabinose 1-dehydrogenase-like Zn-dependent alcohol dehydrogenase
MDSKSIIGCHFANPYESKKANDLVVSGRINPFVSSVFSFDKTDNALEQFVENGGFGKVVVTVLADDLESGVSNHNLFEVNGE